METRVRLLSPEDRGKYDISLQENHRNEAKSEKRKSKKGRSCVWMQYMKSLKSIGDATIVQSCLKKSRKGDVWEKMELCTKIATGPKKRRNSTGNPPIIRYRSHHQFTGNTTNAKHHHPILASESLRNPTSPI